MANCGTHTFTIKWNQLQKLLETNNERDVSQMFNIAGFNWRIECRSHKGSLDVFLRLMEIPSEFEFILIQRNIECLETIRVYPLGGGFSIGYTLIALFTSMRKYDDNHMILSALNDAMTIEEIKNLQIEQLSLKINVKILTIYSIKNELLFSGILSIKSPNEIKWEISNDCIQQLKHSHYRKRFYSQLKNDSLFVIIIKCNYSENNVGLFLNMIHFGSHDAYKLIVRYKETFVR
eukprot:292648_1